MTVLPAPNFGAAGSYLAAPYSLDFSKDLNYVIPMEGTWQGDRKAGKSLYIDNYSNNISITVSSGNYSIRIPAYTAAYIDLRGFNDVFVSSDVAGATPNAARLSTEVKQTEMISRGNSPATVAVTPFSYYGSVNLTSTYGIGPTVFCPDNNCIYIFPANASAFLVFDCAQGKVVSVVQYDSSITVPQCITYYKNKVYIGFSNAAIGVVDVLTNAITVYALTGQIGAYNINYLAAHETEGYLYFQISDNTYSVYRIVASFSSGAVKVSSPGVRGLYMYWSKQWNAVLSLYGDGAGDIHLLRYNGGVQGANLAVNCPYSYLIGGFDYDPATDTLFIPCTVNGSSTVSYIYAACIYAGTSYLAVIINNVNTQLISFNQSDKYLYGVKGYDVLDTFLRGTIGTMPVVNGGYRSMVYNSVNGYTYFYCNDSLLRWGK